MRYEQRNPRRNGCGYRPGNGHRYRSGHGLLFAVVLLALFLTACGGEQKEGVSSDGAVLESEGTGGQADMGGQDGQTAQTQNVADEPEVLEYTANAEMGGEQEEGTDTVQNATEETQTDGNDAASGGLESYLTQDGYPDLESLQKINTDIYAWLDIPGTGISFPILQSAEDETYYLSHNEAREEDDAGCIYTEYFNRKDFSDPNTVIYGRNVDGRFAQLHDYQDRDYFDSNRSLNIYLEDRVLQYEIFAAYNYDDRHLIKIYDFWDKDIYASYLETIFSQRAMDAYVDTSIEVTADDQIITLSTGVTGQDDKRYLVQAVRVSG